jgi:thiol-disulfide isomerase/thioredoxin
VKRELIFMIVISLLSALAGVTLYRYFIFQPEFVSSSAAPASANQQKPSGTLKFSDISMPDLEQQSQPLTRWDDKPLMLINFWAPWCAPCRREIPALIETQKAYADKLQLVGFSFDTLENVRDYRKNFDFNYPLLLVDQQTRAINEFFGNHSGGLPFTVILNAQREVIYRHSGEIDQSQLDAVIKPAL